MAHTSAPLRTRLAYVGSRSYIRGADLFSWFERYARERLARDDQPRRVRSFKVHREVKADGAWQLGSGETGSATLAYVDALGRDREAVFVEQGAPIEAREPDIASSVVELEHGGDFAGRAVLEAPASTSDFLNGLIEANKAFHSDTLRRLGLPADRIRFIYVEELPLVDARTAREEALEFRHLGRRRADGRTYTLNAVRRASGDATLRICYSV